MSAELGLDSNSTLSDNITRIRMQGAQLGSPDVLNELVSVTRENGFSRRECAGARTIYEALTARNDSDASALRGFVDHLISAHESANIFELLKGIGDISRENELPSLGWMESTSASNEKQQTDTIRLLQEELLRNPKLAAQPDRVFHQKRVLGRMCKLFIRDDIPAFAKVRPFSEAGEFPAAIRFSNGQGVPFHDKEFDVRGVAVKFFSNSGEETDILMTNAPASFARDADQFLRVAKILVAQQAAGKGLKGMIEAGEQFLSGVFEDEFSWFETVRIARALTQQTAFNQPDSLATQQFWGSVVRFGDYAVRMTLVPDRDAPQETLGDKEDEDFLCWDLDARIKSGGVKFALRLLFFTDEDITPVNDASKSWDHTPAQFDVADLVISPPRPDQAGAGATEQDINQMPFNPGNGFEGLAITRDRKAIYKASAAGRHASTRDDYERFFRTEP